MLIDKYEQPIFCFCGYRKFLENEFHISRISTENILILMSSGTLNFTEDGKEVSIHKGEYYIQKSGLKQSAKIPSVFPEYFFIHFTCRINDNLCGLPLYGKIDYNDLENTITRLYCAILSPSPSFFMKTYLFYKILDHISNSYTNSGTNVLNDIINYFQENYTENISISDLEKITHYSKDYISKTFKKAYNLTPHQYLLKLRVEHAKSLLSSTKKNIMQISEECGFNDPSTFYRAFLNVTKLTPKQFRNDN